MTEIDTIPGGDGRHHRLPPHGSGTPIVLLHGITETGAIYEPLIERLCDGHEVVVPDLAGHGASASARIVSMDDIVADVSRLIERLGLKSPLIVGHAYGAAVASFLAGAGAPRGTVIIDRSST